jgi:hypothetical protein
LLTQDTGADDVVGSERRKTVIMSSSWKDTARLAKERHFARPEVGVIGGWRGGTE